VRYLQVSTELQSPYAARSILVGLDSHESVLGGTTILAWTMHDRPVVAVHKRGDNRYLTVQQEFVCLLRFDFIVIISR
jgi:20S proteasome alpha/beta subunit